MGGFVWLLEAFVLYEGRQKSYLSRSNTFWRGTASQVTRGEPASGRTARPRCGLRVCDSDSVKKEMTKLAVKPRVGSLYGSVVLARVTVEINTKSAPVGSKALEYSNGIFDCQSPTSPFMGSLRALHLVEDLRGLLEMMEADEREGLRCQIPDSTAEALIEWLQSQMTNGHISGNGDVYQERLARLENDKESLVLQVSVLTDQVEAQGEKIRDLEFCLEEHREKLNATEEMLQQELLSRTTLETQKLDLMAEISTLKLKLTSVEKDRLDYEDRFRDTEVMAAEPGVGETAEGRMWLLHVEGCLPLFPCPSLVLGSRQLNREAGGLSWSSAQGTQLQFMSPFVLCPLTFGAVTQKLGNLVPGYLGSSELLDLDLIQEINELRLRVGEMDNERLQYEKKLKTTKDELSALKDKLEQKEAEVKRLHEKLVCKLKGEGIEILDRDIEVQKMKKAVESLMAANEEKDRKIEELRQSLNRYKKVQDMVILAQGKESESEDLSSGSVSTGLLDTPSLADPEKSPSPTPVTASPIHDEFNVNIHEENSLQIHTSILQISVPSFSSASKSSETVAERLKTHPRPDPASEMRYYGFHLLKMVVRHCQNKRASISNLRRRGNSRDVWLQPGAVAELWHPKIPMLGASDRTTFLILHPPCPGRKPNPCRPALALQGVQKSTPDTQLNKGCAWVFFFWVQIPGFIPRSIKHSKSRGKDPVQKPSFAQFVLGFHLCLLLVKTKASTKLQPSALCLKEDQQVPPLKLIYVIAQSSTLQKSSSLSSLRKEASEVIMRWDFFTGYAVLIKDKKKITPTTISYLCLRQGIEAVDVKPPVEGNNFATLPPKSPCHGGTGDEDGFGTRKARSSFGRGFFKIKNNKRTASAPNLAETEKGSADHLDLAGLPPRPKEADSLQMTPPSPDSRKKARGIKKLFGRLKRSQSTTFNPEDMSETEFKRGGTRATAGPRLGWSRDLGQSHNELDMPFAKWTKEQVCNWLQDQGLGSYINNGRHWILSGQTLLQASQQDLEKELGIKHPLHRKKLQLALQALGSEEENNHGKLDYHWVTRWLDDIGLPQYKTQFDEGKVDGRMLHYMTVDDLLSLKVISVLHHLSIKRAIQVLRINNFEPNCLRRRPSDESNVTPSEVTQWTNHRVMEWLRSVDLAEYAPNLRGSGVHGGLMVLEPRFNVETMAQLLNIPPNKTLLRRHLATHFNLLVGQEAQQQKREAMESPDYVLLTATAKVKPKKLTFSNFGSLRKKKQDDMEEYVCPMELGRASGSGSKKGFKPGLDIRVYDDDDLDRLEQHMLKEDEMFKDFATRSPSTSITDEDSNV
ncbi:hypothetical protein IHE44_0011941 [Lamprotornis superbus]|uniref:SAM domain-containing protein n=1 Tax=Lamprotornis superbus TaxID=245042 RepID=A0A835NE02_9PASS|nr:hypothetical protein IHE44_0011941 [Lamprotornis superbus]